MSPLSLLSVMKRAGPSGFGYANTAEQVTEGLDLRGRTYLLTGCNSGLGQETLRVLCLRGGHVIAVARSESKAREAIRAAGSGSATAVACELSEPESVHSCVEAVKGLGRPLDGIICNAGIMLGVPRLQQKHGYELQFFTNHVGHFILVTGLLESLAEKGRVVLVSSNAYRGAPEEGIQLDNLSGEDGYSPGLAYCQSKLANLLFARELARRLPAGQSAYSVLPGTINTNITRHMTPVFRGVFAILGAFFLRTIPQGAATQCYVATQPDLEAHSGRCFSDCNLAATIKHGEDDALAVRLWSATEEIVAKLG